MTWLPSSSSPHRYARIQGFPEGTRAAGGAQGILTQQSQTFVGISHYLPNISFYKMLQEHSCPSFSSLTHPGRLVQISKISTTGEQAFSGWGEGSVPSPQGFSHWTLPSASSQIQREAEDTPACSPPPSSTASCRKRTPSRGSPTAVRLWKLCRLRLWNSSTVLLQLIIPAAWIPNLGL